MSGVFISYRRDDSGGYAGRLYDALVAHFGKDLIFIDIDSIRAGENFADVIDRHIAACSVVVVLIGKSWLKSVDDQGNRRLDNPRDFVRLEAASALAQRIPVIPVLVGGAKMPRPDDLPEPLKSLAHLNAIEIFDQLFHDSIKHFIDTLHPFVRPKFQLWPWGPPLTHKARILLIAIFLSITIGVAAIIASLGSGQDRHTLETASPPASATLAGPDDSSAPSARIKVMKPPEISELPPVVEASRNVIFPGSSDQVIGPVKPRILWRATVTIGDVWNVLGIATDGTVYLWDSESDVLEALRDGKEVWAYRDDREEWITTISPVFTNDGRVWIGDYCFNSRGEGGRISKRNLRPDPATIRNQQPQNKYVCSDGKVSGTSAGRNTWSVDLDGNCGSQSLVPAVEGGNVYATSDARTLYAISPAGQVLWKAEQACKKSDVYIHPLPIDDVVVACSDQSLYCLRKGKLRWTFMMDSSSEWSWSNTIFDKSGNIYVGMEGSSAITQLASVNDSGKLMWKVPGGATFTPMPIGFDPQGRLYVSVAGRIVCLSN
jgi:outer membrane protein assembly factor BamB